MKINVAGAGAGKTTKMAERIGKYLIPDGKILFCIAFTNNAVENITQKLTEKFGGIPENIRISTIHSFLYRELIAPYYYFLFEKQFKELSAINLPSKLIYRNKRLSELEAMNILHFSKIPEKAKWVAYQKSGDKKEIKEKRKKILKFFSSYCAAIFVDEAQDINADMKLILEALDKTGIEIILYGDPKQDIKGYNQFRLLTDNCENICYISECYRCPQIHLDLSNTLALDNEQQFATEQNKKGILDIIFETEINNFNRFLSSDEYGLRYISKRQERFETHKNQSKDQRFNTLYYEVKTAIEDKWGKVKSEIEVSRCSFYISEQILKEVDEKRKEKGKIISDLVQQGFFNQLSKPQYARIISAFGDYETNFSNIVFDTIEGVKGLESDRCLFILSSDLAPYLFQDKVDDNKEKHLLYVALTRSRERLTILVTKEVEKKYGKESIEKFFCIYMKK